MSMDLFASNIDDAVAYAGRVSAPELPSTFEDNIADAWSRGRLVESSVSGSLRKSRALSDYMDEVTAKSGTSLQMGETVDGFPSIGEMAVKVREIKAANPNVDIADLSDEEIQRRADEIGVRQIADSAALDRRERTTGGSVGSFLGTAGAAVIDPVNLIAFPLAAPTSLGILGTALAWGAIGAGSQTAIEALNMSDMERIQPGYGSSGEPLENILGAGLAGGVLGGGLKGLSSAWTRAKTGSWPRSVRDAGNVVDSEAQIAATNPMAPPESIANAAVVAKDGTIFTGSFHGEAFEKAIAAGNSAESLRLTDGFVTTTGRYVDRSEAAKIAAARDQFRTKQDYLTQVSGIGERSEAIFAKDYDEALAGRGRLYAQHVRQYGDASEGITGEAAHRTALNKAIDDIANGRPVDVDGIVSPEMVPHIEAWHGSPHDFEQFDIARIGTGEGAQSYGHGLYFAENHGVARSYQLMDGATVNGKPFDINNPVHKAVSLIDEFGSREAAIKEAAARTAHDPGDFYGDVLMHLESGRQLPQLDAAGKMYKVRITADREHMLDWDKPLSEQSDHVKAALQKLGIDVSPQKTAAELANEGLLDPSFVGRNGAAAYEELADKLKTMKKSEPDANGFYRFDDGKESASRALSDAGITGIKYLDQGSRDAGDGTRNFVVFNDKHVQITHKNGKPVTGDVRQNVVDQAAGLPPKQPELGLTQPEPAVPPGPNAEVVAALRDDLTPQRIDEMRTDVDMADTIERDLDKLMLEKPDLEVPNGVTVDAEGRTVATTRKIESVIAEADARSAAAKEIEACVGPYPAEAA